MELSSTPKGKSHSPAKRMTRWTMTFHLTLEGVALVTSVDFINCNVLREVPALRKAVIEHV